ncbi:MAG: tRNA pseudouridine(55) synthase TruB [Phycisphaerae bacterium]|nr:tRNA pseudouridine(55) synthase TruB [Phycisphaerae bacterium]
MKNRRPDLNGILVLDKPLGWTSADCCRYIRKGTGGAKVGHAGTLDPLATGVLVLCLGRATKLIDGLMASEKRYLAEVDLAHTSPTDDLEAPPVAAVIGSIPSETEVRAACARFVGEVMQTPPVYSAIWVDGERSYDLARRGEGVALAARRVDIHSIDVVRYEWPRLTIDVRCGKGTYIRSLARDLGGALGVGGMLTSLRRTASGRFTEAEARDPSAITQGLVQADLLDVGAEAG